MCARRCVEVVSKQQAMQVSFLCYIFLHNTLHTTTVKQHYACLPLPEFPTLSVPIEVENRRGKCMKPANPLLCPLPLDGPFFPSARRYADSLQKDQNKTLV